MLVRITACLALACAVSAEGCLQKKPNIVLILSDDQDRRMGSTGYQSILHRDIISQGVEFTNHFGTNAQCCPSRASLLRGQATHNTNITHVSAPGGNYDKWVASGLDQDYLPFWLKHAGYRAEYVGKLLNGYSTVNANVTPKGWDWVDSLLDPYTTYYNVPVMSRNGERPVYYQGFHQTDVIRTKALSRLDYLTSQEKPFYLQIAPYAPHVQNSAHRPIPLLRHMESFSDVQAPRLPNFNPTDDEAHSKKGGWVGTLPVMNESVIETADFAYRSRIQALQGVDEIIEDVIAMLEAKGILDETYVIYTSDNGYHIGQHRIPAGKALFYGEDTNLPFAVRGPGIPKNVTSSIPSIHLDLAPTFLDIIGLPKKYWPSFLDGSSLLNQWKNPLSGNGPGEGDGNSKETINVEFWGLCQVEAPSGADLGAPFMNNSYKTLRVLGEDESWLFSTWCTGESELYNTAEDPYELINLAEDPESIGVFNRLNALLLVTKSCAEGTCRDPWAVFTPPDNSTIRTFKQAMDAKYDDYFASFPRVHFNTCMQYQDIENEMPFYPEAAASGLGLAHRAPTDNFVSVSGGVAISDPNYYGDSSQRHVTLEQIYENARNLTDDELNTPSRGGGAEKRWGVEEIPEWIRIGHD
ncbi:arylsulfatase [Xylariomycetidae sp. FL2044]|nr:arylsulfatase [Xylariomycetidae sp. FL2044]